MKISNNPRLSDKPIQIKEIWRHKRTQKLYKIIALGHIESDHTPCVIYESVQGGQVWVRPRIEFYDGRFEKVN